MTRSALAAPAESVCANEEASIWLAYLISIRIQAGMPQQLLHMQS